MRHVCWFLLVLFACSAFAAQTTVSFDEFLPNPGEYIRNVSLADEAATFLNTYEESYNYWAGFAFSTVSNTTDGTLQNQYAAAEARTNAYAVGFDDGGWHDAPEICFDLPAAPQSLLLNNTTWAAVAIREGCSPARPFAEGDYFYVTFDAYDLDGEVIATTNYYLADFRDGREFIQTNWVELDLSWMPPEVASLVGTMTTSDVGQYGPNTPMYFALADFTYGYSDGSDGVASTNPAILCWADGWTNYLPGTNVVEEWKTPSNALGAAQGYLGGLGATNGIVSLGDGGSITLSFPVPIADGPGADFAVFENAFADTFLELAFVEVSSDGENFFRFPSHCLETNWIDTYTQTNASDPTAYGGLAGKHTQGYGTPFDLRLLAGTPGLDTRRVTHVRIVDIPGDGSVVDAYGNPIFDPYPTWGSGGFDLDAVGVLNVNVDISCDPTAPPPVLPGYTTHLEYKARLEDAAWTTDAPPQGAPGFFRWRLLKDE
jgi:hypothetical protein